MSALSLATLGVMCGNTRALSMATLGVFCVAVEAPPEYTGGGERPGYYDLPRYEDELKERIEREDLDIIALVIAAIESGIIK